MLSPRINIWREGVKTEPSFSVVPSDGRKGNGHVLRHQEFNLNIIRKTNQLACVLTSEGDWAPGQAAQRGHLDTKNSPRPGPEQLAPADPALCRVVDEAAPAELPSSRSHSVSLSYLLVLHLRAHTFLQHFTEKVNVVLLLKWEVNSQNLRKYCKCKFCENKWATPPPILICITNNAQHLKSYHIRNTAFSPYFVRHNCRIKFNLIQYPILGKTWP